VRGGAVAQGLEEKAKALLRLVRGDPEQSEDGALHVGV
jgi:hypothetical protein